MDTLPLELYEQIRDLTFTTRPSIKSLAGWHDIHWAIQYNALNNLRWRAHCKSGNCAHVRAHRERKRDGMVTCVICSACGWYSSNVWIRLNYQPTK